MKLGAKKYNALIIGTGNIGAFYDNPDSDRIISHGHGFSDSDKFELIGFVDIDEKNGKKGAEIWNTNYYKTIDEAFSVEKRIDVISIAVPDKHHYDVLKQASQYSLKCLIVEKPITQTLNQAYEIIEIYQKKQIPIIVNYTRRFIGQITKIKEDIESNKYGKYLNGIGYYGKGILHNGSHMIDLINYFFEEIKEYQIIDKYNDYYEEDPSVSGILTLKNSKKLIIQYVDCKISTIFELDLFFEKCRVRISELGYKIEYFQAKESPYFKGYTNYVESEEISTELDRAMSNLVEHTYRVITENQKLKSSANSAYEAMKICIALKEG